MYTLTLTKADRDAFDWVGGRYNAHEIAGLLESTWDDEDKGWNEDNQDDMTFNIPEHIAWEIDELAKEEDYTFPCFASDLRHKMEDFCNSIV